jgi:hypothetical protein
MQSCYKIGKIKVPEISLEVLEVQGILPKEISLQTAGRPRVTESSSALASPGTIAFLSKK